VAISEMTGARVGTLSEGSNTAGGHLAGALPHRSSAGESRSANGLDAAAMLDSSLDVTLLFGLEPNDVTCTADAGNKLASHGFVVAFTPYTSEALEESANLMLPMGTFAETSGTFVNCEGRWQSFAGIANPVGESRPGWKILRVLGNLLDADGFEYQSSEEVLDELRQAIGDVRPDNSYKGAEAIASANGADEPGDEIDVSIYSVDPVVRRAAALQLTPEAERAAGDAS
jgi:NADH-quinone oxidoreductase subunit G